MYQLGLLPTRQKTEKHIFKPFSMATDDLKAECKCVAHIVLLTGIQKTENGNDISKGFFVKANDTCRHCALPHIHSENRQYRRYELNSNNKK